MSTEQNIGVLDVAETGLLDECRELFDALSQGVYLVDRDRRIFYWNQSAADITGYGADDVMTTHCWDHVLRHVDGLGNRLCGGGCPLQLAMETEAHNQQEAFLQHKDGHRLPVSITCVPLRDREGQVVGAATLFAPTAASVALQERISRLERQALVDPLTGISNRRYVATQLDARLNEFKRYGWQFGVLFLDVDDFKKVNDTYGHVTGDTVLRTLAATLGNNARSFDLPGRWGGEEFMVLVNGVKADELYALAERLRALLATSGVALSNERLCVTVSVGATLALPDDSVLSLVERADALMYRSKEEGKNRVTIG